jgi:hypothetical protein
LGLGDFSLLRDRGDRVDRYDRGNRCDRRDRDDRDDRCFLRTTGWWLS